MSEMNIPPKKITIDDVEYVRADSVEAEAEVELDAEWVIVRSRDAGVFAGILSDNGNGECKLIGARRLWYWSGAASLSELAMKGVSDPDNCKFPVTVPEIFVFGVCEIIPMSKKAVASITAVPVWSAS